MQIIGLLLIPSVIFLISTKLENKKAKEIFFNIAVIFLIIAVIGYLYPNNMNASLAAIAISLLFVAVRRIYLKRYDE